MENITKKTSKLNWIFFILFFLLIIGSISITFVKIVIQKDYQIIAETSCNPESEQCFVYICDPVEDSTCPIDEAERIYYYKIISKKAANIALCEASTDKIGCDTELSCTSEEIDCSYTYCNPNKLATGEECSQ